MTVVTNNIYDFRSKRRFRQGFTIVELVVVISLVVALTAVVLLRQRSFHNTILLRNTAYELALSIREAQAYGISVRRDPTDVVSGRYGVHVSLGAPDSTIIYTDSNENNMYDVGEDRRTNVFQKPFSVKNICVTPASGTEECADDSGSLITGLEILFVRPDPDAYLYVVRSVGGLESVSKARVSIGMPEGVPNDKYVDVIVSKLGQVAVQ